MVVGRRRGSTLRGGCWESLWFWVVVIETGGIFNIFSMEWYELGLYLVFHLVSCLAKDTEKLISASGQIS